jgi:hypothetical protein
VAMFEYLALQPSEPPGRVPSAEGISPDTETSEFIASGGLVPDRAPPDGVEESGSNHAAATAPAPGGAAAF